MVSTIQIGKSKVGMMANAATPYRYKQVFREDILKYLNDVSEKDDVELIEKLGRLGYIMAMQHKASKPGSDIVLSQLSEEDYYNWLEGVDLTLFTSMDAAVQIYNLYRSQEVTTSDVKKKSAPQSAR